MADAILIRGARILTMAGPALDSGDIRIENGRITAVGSDLGANGAKVVEAKGLTAMPGLIDAHCHVGMWEDSLNFEGSDGNEITDPVTPDLRAIDAINPEDRCLRDAVVAGVTTACTGPGSANVVGGQFAVIKLHGHDVDAMTLRAPHAVKVAFGENPKTCYHDLQKMPSTRMATAALLRRALTRAADYRRKLLQGQKDPDKLPDTDLGMEALVAVLEGKLPLKAHAHRADDILTAIRIAREFGVKMTLDHCTEGYRIPEELKKAGMPVILGPLFSDRSKPELRNLTMKAPAILERAGIPFAMMTDHPVIPLEYLLVTVMVAVREGLSEEAGLRSVTVEAARALGLENRIGSIAAGLDADIALYDGHPLDIRSKVRRTYVNGELVFEA